MLALKIFLAILRWLLYFLILIGGIYLMLTLYKILQITPHPSETANPVIAAKYIFTGCMMILTPVLTIFLMHGVYIIVTTEFIYFLACSIVEDITGIKILK